MPAETTAQPIRLLIHGANGQMGRALLRLCPQQPGCHVVAAVSRSQPPQRVIDGVPHFRASELAAVPDFDVAIDFSLPEGLEGLLGLCQRRRAALVSGTTGLSGTQLQALEAAAQDIAVFWASNFSLGVAVLRALVAHAARALPGWDCDIVEAHHTRKLDAPSGTALTLGKAVEGEGGEPRYASLRAGDIVGEHLVQFTGSGERIELVHRAGNRDIFALGALRAARWLTAQPPGRYDMQALVG